MARNGIVRDGELKRQSVCMFLGDGAESSEREAESPSSFSDSVDRLKQWQESHGAHDWSIVHSGEQGFTLWCQDCHSVFAESVERR